jgi:hypothetical protein
MARSRRRKSRSSGRTGAIVGGVCLLVASVALIGGFGYLYARASSQGKIDKETLCPIDGPVAVNAFLIDTTDPISKTTLIDVKNRFTKAVASIPVGGLLEIYGLTEKPGELVKMFEGCNPGDGSTVDQWTNNPARRQRQWEEAFRKPLEEVEGKIPDGQAGNASPIMAAIQNIKLAVFDRFGKPGTPKQLIVVSDMIEHTKIYSQYKSGIGYDAYLQSAANDEYRTSLDGIDVAIWYVDREAKPFSGRDHLEFWAEWIQRSHGNMLPSPRLEGMN